MKDIYVSKDLKIEGIEKYIYEMLYEDENIEGTFSVLNNILANNLTLTNNSSIETKYKENKKFSPFANIYRIVVTDKRLLLVGLNRLNNDVNGIREIGYEEISKLTIKKNLKLKIKLNEENVFNLNIYDTGDNPMVTQEIKKSLEYIKVKLEERFIESDSIL